MTFQKVNTPIYKYSKVFLVYFHSKQKFAHSNSKEVHHLFTLEDVTVAFKPQMMYALVSILA